jgi:hypothetical protein
VTRAWRAIADFLVDFFVGDAPEFLFVTGAVIALSFALSGARVLGAVLLPIFVAASVAVSAWRVRRR